jgi:hypothetical protein
MPNHDPDRIFLLPSDNSLLNWIRPIFHAPHGGTIPSNPAYKYVKNIIFQPFNLDEYAFTARGIIFRWIYDL